MENAKINLLKCLLQLNKQKAIASLKSPYVNASQNFLNKGKCISVYAKT